MSAIEGSIMLLHLFHNGTFQAERLSLIKRRRKARVKRVLTVLAVVMCCTIIELIYGRHEKTIWMNPKSSHWWEDVVLRSFGARDWLENFSQSKYISLPLSTTEAIRRKAKPCNEEANISGEMCGHYTVDTGYSIGVSQCGSFSWDSKMHSLYYCQGNL